MKSYSSRKVISILKADGWYEVACDGDHHQFKRYISIGREKENEKRPICLCGNFFL